MSNSNEKPEKPEVKSPMMIEVEKLEKELAIITEKYNVIGAREKQQVKNLLDKIENRQKLENYAFKGVSMVDILKNAIKEVEVPEKDKNAMVELKKKINAYKTIMG